MEVLHQNLSNFQSWFSKLFFKILTSNHGRKTIKKKSFGIGVDRLWTFPKADSDTYQRFKILDTKYMICNQIMACNRKAAKFKSYELQRKKQGNSNHETTKLGTHRAGIEKMPRLTHLKRMREGETWSLQVSCFKIFCFYSNSR